MDERLGARADANVAALKANPYPGRGIVVGLSPDGKEWVQVYWIMGRSANSRNRVFVADASLDVRTKAYDESKLEDPSLIIYYAARALPGAHVLSNGDQTDTVWGALRSGGRFEDALATREFEPDAPNYTPRITALLDLDESARPYRLSILKRGASGGCERHFFDYPAGLPGLGHMIHTYEGDGDPLPSFRGEPREVPIPGGADESAAFYWTLLDRANRVSLFAKSVDRKSGAVRLRVVNAHGAAHGDESLALGGR